jgi:2-(1,2-epoxy-1,2-dihydrophenyl)acetyl-CoA isomerase
MSFYDELVAVGDETAEDAVQIERGAGRARIVMRRPEKLNALSAGVVRGVRHAFQQLLSDTEVRVIVLTGEDPAFSAGGDLSMMRASEERLADPAGSTDVWRWIRREFGGIARDIAGSDKAVIAALNGPAAGVGLAWALTADLTIASERAVLVPAFGRLGLVPEVGTSWVLTRALGLQGAFAYYVSGRHLSAEEAREAGLVHEVVPHGELGGRVEEWCERILALPPHALEMTKPLLRSAADANWSTAIALEELAEPHCFTTRSFQAAVRDLSERPHQGS